MLSTKELVAYATNLEKRMIESGDPFCGDDYMVVQVLRAYRAMATNTEGARLAATILQINEGIINGPTLFDLNDRGYDDACVTQRSGDWWRLAATELAHKFYQRWSNK